jgi:hypothetical protein
VVIVQALGDFYFPQLGIFAMGRVYVDTSPAAAWAGRNKA